MFTHINMFHIYLSAYEGFISIRVINLRKLSTYGWLQFLTFPCDQGHDCSLYFAATRPAKVVESLLRYRKGVLPVFRIP